MDSLTQAPGDGLILDIILSDFVKAFNKAPHKSRLYKLQAYSVWGEPLQWINSFRTH